MDSRCFRQGKRGFFFLGAGKGDGFRGFPIGPVAAGRAEDKGVLPRRGKEHKFVGKTAAHHPGVRSHGQHLGNACPGKDAFISLVASKIISVQILHGGMEGISVLHGKFPDPDKSCPGTCFIPEFGLDLVKHKGITAVGGAIIPYKVHRRFFMGHSQHQRGTVPIVKAHKFAAHGFIASRFLPERGGKHHRELHLLPVQGIHFLPYDLFQLFRDTAEGRKRRIDPVCHILHIAAPQHEGVAFDDTVGGSFFKALPNQVGKFHDNNLLWIHGRTAFRVREKPCAPAPLSRK